MTNILFIRAASQNIGGIEKQILLIAREFGSRKLFNPILATSDKFSEFGKRFERLGFSVYELPMGKDDGLNRGAEAIELILKKHNVALIQSHMFRESLIGRLVRRKHPEIRHIFRAHTYIDCSWIPRWRKLAYHILDKLTSRYVDRYVCISQNAFKEISEFSWISKSKISLITDGVEKIGEPDQPESNLTLPLPPQVAMVSNLIPHKGHDVLFRALWLLKQKGLRVCARLIGGELTGGNKKGFTPFTDNLKQEASRMGILDQIDFYGYTQNIYEALKGFSTLVLPSDSEGIPNCILEGLCLRKLAIASSVGGVPEIIRHRVNGLLHPPRDAHALAAILEEVFTTPAKIWESIRDAGYKTWKDRFSVDQMIEGLTRIYKEMDILQ